MAKKIKGENKGTFEATIEYMEECLNRLFAAKTISEAKKAANDLLETHINKPEQEPESLKEVLKKHGHRGPVAVSLSQLITKTATAPRFSVPVAYGLTVLAQSNAINEHQLTANNKDLMQWYVYPLCNSVHENIRSNTELQDFLKTIEARPLLKNSGYYSNKPKYIQVLPDGWEWSGNKFKSAYGTTVWDIKKGANGLTMVYITSVEIPTLRIELPINQSLEFIQYMYEVAKIIEDQKYTPAIKRNKAQKEFLKVVTNEAKQNAKDKKAEEAYQQKLAKYYATLEEIKGTKRKVPAMPVPPIKSAPAKGVYINADLDDEKDTRALSEHTPEASIRIIPPTQKPPVSDKVLAKADRDDVVKYFNNQNAGKGRKLFVKERPYTVSFYLDYPTKGAKKKRLFLCTVGLSSEGYTGWLGLYSQKRSKTEDNYIYPSTVPFAIQSSTLRGAVSEAVTAGLTKMPDTYPSMPREYEGSFLTYDGALNMDEVLALRTDRTMRYDATKREQASRRKEMKARRARGLQRSATRQATRTEIGERLPQDIAKRVKAARGARGPYKPSALHMARSIKYRQLRIARLEEEIKNVKRIYNI